MRSEYDVLDDGAIEDAVESGVVYETYCSRWLMLVLFCGLTFTNAFVWITFASIEVYTAEYFGVSRTAVNFLSVIYMIMYLPGSMLAAYMLSTSGFRRTIVVGACFNLSGSWLRYLSIFTPVSLGWFRYSVLLLGQLLCSLGQPFFVNTSAKLAGDWFAASERDVATVIASLVNPIGNAAGQALPPILVTCASSGDNYHTNSTIDSCAGSNDIHGMGTLLLIQAIVASITSLAAIMMFKGAPPTPPSASASQRTQMQVQSERPLPENSTSSEGVELHWNNALEANSVTKIKESLVFLVFDSEFRKLMIGFGLGLGIFNALLTMLAQVIQPIYYDSRGVLNKAALSNDAGLYGMILIGSGLVGAGIFGYLLDTYKAYRLTLKFLFTFSSSCMVTFFLCIEPNSRILWALSAAVGFFALPLLPVALQSAVECTYPIPEELSATCLILFGNIVGIVCTFSIQGLLELKHYRTFSEYGTVFTPSLLFVASVMFIAWISIVLFNGKYKRLEAEKSA